MELDITDRDAFKEIIRRSRAREIHDLVRGLVNGHVIIYGEAGIGKTAFLETLRAAIHWHTTRSVGCVAMRSS